MAQIILCGGISLVSYIRPVGIYQLANVLRQNGYTVQVIDSFPWIVYLGLDQVLKLFDKFVGPETLWIGFGSTWFLKIEDLINKPSNNIHAGKNLTETFIKNTLMFSYDDIEVLKNKVYEKNSKIKFVMGGARAPTGRNGFCSPLIDCYIEGYADSTVLEYTKFLEGKNPFLPFRKNSDDSISLTHDHKAQSFDYNNFKFTWDDSDLINPGEMLPMEIARGCIFSCSFCSYPLNGRKKLDYLKNPAVLRDQFIENYDRFGTTNYFFLDDTFNDSVEKLEILNNEVFKKLPFKINFGTYMRLDLINAHRETVHILKEMGLSGAMFGIESLNYEANKSVGKGIKLEKVIEIGNLLKQEWGDSVLMDSQYIIGLPFDGAQEIREWAKIVTNDDFPIQTSKILPLFLDRNKLKKNIWVSDFEINPTKYGYTFPDPKNSNWWVNNKGLSFGDAIELEEEFNELRKPQKASVYLSKHGKKMLGVDTTKPSYQIYSDMWSNTENVNLRINFTKNYIDRLLAL